jgi:hypothetical protein
MQQQQDSGKKGKTSCPHKLNSFSTIVVIIARFSAGVNTNQEQYVSKTDDTQEFIQAYNAGTQDHQGTSAFEHAR